MKEIVKLIDLRTCDMTLSEVMAFIDRWKAENPGKEIWLDGDAYAIVTEKDEPGKLDRKCPLCGRTLELSKGNRLWYLVCPSCGEVRTYYDEPALEEVREWCSEISDEGLIARMIRECDDKSKIQGIFVKSPEYIAEVMRYIADTFDTESAHGAADDLMVILLRGMGYEDAMDIYEKMNKWYA